MHRYRYKIMIPQFVEAIWTDTRLNDSREGTTGNSKALGLPVLPYKADGSFAYIPKSCCDYVCGGLKHMSTQKSS